MSVGIWSRFLTVLCLETEPHMSHIYCDLYTMQVIEFF